MRTLPATALTMLALGIAPKAEEVLSSALRTLVKDDASRPCLPAAGWPVVAHSWVGPETDSRDCKQSW
jgi:hypothetical protein